MKWHVTPPINARVEQRTGASPIFRRGEDVEGLGGGTGERRSVELSPYSACDRVSLRAIRKREQVYGSVEAADRISCLSWQCVAMIDARAPSTCGGNEHAVESLSATFIGIEPVEHELAQNPGALRIAKADGPSHRPHRAERGYGRDILESTCHIPKRGEAQPGNLWLLSLVYKLVCKVCLKAARKFHGTEVPIPGCAGRVPNEAPLARRQPHGARCKRPPVP